jgi:hypothetical protein
MATFNIQLQGYPPANRAAEIKLVNRVTGVETVRQPFLDGTLLLRDMDPGPYELQVTHPNLIQPIEQREIRLFPQPTPTFVPIRVPPVLFVDTPIRETPDADVGPVQRSVTAARDRLAPIGAKGPGEAIRASDWNTLVGAVSDLAQATLELTNLLSPRGHDHPEIEEQIAEAQDNIRRFGEAFGRTILELRREIEAASLRRRVIEVADLAPPEIRTAVKTRLLERVSDLEAVVRADTPTFTSKLASSGNVFLSEVNDIAVAAGAGGDDFRATPVVQALVDTARAYQDAGTQVRPEGELGTYLRTARVTGGQFLAVVER